MTDKELPGKQSKQTSDPLNAIDPSQPGSDDWQSDLVNRLAFSAINEQRRTRRWNVFFKGLLALYLGAILLLYWPSDWTAASLAKEKHTALIEMKGIISDKTEASADTVISGLQAAFEDKKTAGIILRINSPGGSPVQSAYIHNEIKRLREKYPDTHLYAVITDMCASGGYFVASAADEIYVDKSSIIGSIGVRMDSFGFVGSLDKLGIERRLYTAGENKGFLDPFLPSKETDVVHITKVLENIHEQFMDAVKEGRGERLSDNPEIFSGLIWTGEEGIELGLADKIGSAGYVAREVIGQESVVDFTQEPDLLKRISDRIGVAMAESLSKIFIGTEAIH